MCAPWVKGYDAAQGRANFVMCPSAYMAKIIGTNDPWIAPAGLNRGIKRIYSFSNWINTILQHNSR